MTKFSRPSAVTAPARELSRGDAMIIGLISDTHGLLRPEIARVFAGVDRILHAGDVGNHAVLEGLARIAPVDAVFGNVDDPHDPALARERTLTHDGIVIHVSHGHEMRRPTAALVLSRYARRRRRLRAYPPCGHPAHARWPAGRESRRGRSETVRRDPERRTPGPDQPGPRRRHLAWQHFSAVAD